MMEAIKKNGCYEQGEIKFLMDRGVTGREGYVWEIFSEKVIFELSYNLAIQNVFLCITLSLSIFLNSFFLFYQECPLYMYFFSLYSCIIFTCRLLSEG